MKPYEFKGFYHPKPGKFVHQHKGSGIIVDNIFKPMKSVMSYVGNKFGKKVGKKAITHLSKKADKRISEKTGGLIMERLRNMRNEDVKQKAIAPPIEHQQQKESTNMILNRLISGSGVKRRRRV